MTFDRDPPGCDARPRGESGCGKSTWGGRYATRPARQLQHRFDGQSSSISKVEHCGRCAATAILFRIPAGSLDPKMTG